MSRSLPLLVAEVVAADQPDVDSTPGNGDPVEDDIDAVELRVDVATLTGTVWLDRDRDGVFDADEPGIPGVVVVLYDADGEVVASTTTDDDGHYVFTDLPPGTYTVAIDPSTLPDTIDGQTYDPDDVADGRTTVTLEAGETVTGVDFGYGPPADPEGPADPADPSGPVAPWEPGGLTPSNLARTGQAVAPLVAAGLGLLLAGAAVAAAVRRRLGVG